MVNMVILAKRSPLTKRQLAFLRVHILKQRKKLQEENEDGEKSSENKLSGERVNRLTEEKEEKQLISGSDEQKTQSDRSKEPEPETAEDIAKQIELLQSRLESLREEKHQLFQQLKTVLHEEDERKRQKELEQKQQEMEKMTSELGSVDPRLNQGVAGIKRSLPSSPTSTHAGVAPPTKKQHRAPLLPTPDPGAYPRQGAVYRHPSVSESYPPPSRQQFGPRGHMTSGQRPAFHDQRFGHPPQHIQDIHAQGPHGSHDSHMMSHPQIAPQPSHSITYSQPHPPMQEVHTQYPGMQIAGYQCPPTPTPYGSVTNLQQSSGGQSGQPMQMAYQQIPQPGYVQSLPHELPMQGQPLPHEVQIHPHSYSQMPPHPVAHEMHLQNQMPPHEMQMQGHPHHHDIPQYIQGTQMMPTQGFGEYPPGAASFGHIQDPRHQKLVAEHHRTVASGSPIHSPPHSAKHDSATSQLTGSPSQSPAHSSRDRRHTSKK